jgi:hypothetical protein
LTGKAGEKNSAKCEFQEYTPMEKCTQLLLIKHKLSNCPFKYRNSDQGAEGGDVASLVSKKQVSEVGVQFTCRADSPDNGFTNIVWGAGKTTYIVSARFRFLLPTYPDLT